MSCHRNANRVIQFARRLGIPKTAGQSAFLAVSVGAAALAVVAGAKRRRSSEGASELSPVVGPDGRDLPDLPPRPTVKPSSPAPGQRCPGCSAESDKPGPWYAMGGRHHCADCAPDAARKAGVDLAVPAGEKPAVSFDKRPTFGPEALPTFSTTDGAPVLPSHRIVSEPGSSPILIQRNDGSTLSFGLRGVTVLRKEKRADAELAITPVVVEVEGEGPRMLRDSWQITHIASGRQVADIIFKTSDDAIPLGTLLAQFDWNKGDDTLRRELATISATIQSYKEKRSAAAAKMKEQTEAQ